jgi:outer membrane protease
MILRFAQVLTATAALSISSGAALADFASGGPDWPTSGETVSVEPFVGYLRGTSTESVYDPMNKKSKVSQLNWDVQAVTVGGRIAVRPFDGLTVRGRFWTAVSSDASMMDRDWLWLAGYQGRSSWTDQSVHPQTSVPKAWQGDISAAYTLLQDGDIAVTGIAGYRHYEVKYKAQGGTFIYSNYSFRDSIGVFPNATGLVYQQWWDTPYIGLGTFWRSDDFSVSTEIYGSPISIVRSNDNHIMRSLNFQSNFTPVGMVGANLGVEYRFNPWLSLTGRVDYTKYIEAKGNMKIYDFANGTTERYRKPITGIEADTLNLSLGLKAKL